MWQTVFSFLGLFLGAFVAAALSGSAGFGGAMLLLPLLTRAVGPASAVPLLTVAQIVGNASRVALGFRQIRWRSVSLFLLPGLPGAVVGAMCFATMANAVLVRVTGLAILVFVLYCLAGRARRAAGPRTLLAAGAVSGFLSGLVGSAGPVGSAVFLSLDLAPVAYIASDATASLAIHIAKTATYQPLPAGLSVLALLLGLAMILGTLASKKLIERFPKESFRRYVTVLLGLVALHMLVCG